MSSHICSRRHFDSLIRGIMLLYRDSKFSFTKEMTDVAPELLLRNEKIKVQVCVEALVAAFADLQIQCVCLQYKEKDIDVEEDIRLQRSIMQIHLAEPLDLEPVPLYCALLCALQFSTEYLSRPLTQQERDCMVFFLSLRTHLADHIVKNMVEFKESPWNIE